jgi:DNA invertase Pin-like site-specific DNA recombinase
VIDQLIDTSSSTGRLMFNMISSIAEFENDLRAERQREGIAKAIENGVKFGRPPKRTPEIDAMIVETRKKGVSIGKISKQFNLGEATIYRVLKNSR